MSILIFVRVLENSSQRAYFRSCDENAATPLADKREIGRFMAGINSRDAKRNGFARASMNAASFQ